MRDVCDLWRHLRDLPCAPCDVCLAYPATLVNHAASRSRSTVWRLHTGTAVTRETVCRLH